MKVKSLSLVRLPETPRAVAYQAPPSMGFSRQEYWRVAISFSNLNRQNTWLPLLKSLEQKQGFGSQNRVLTTLPAYNPPKWWAKHPSHASGLTPGNIPTLTPYVEQACTPQGTSKAWEPVLYSHRPPHPPPCIRSSNKALPELLASSQLLLIGEGQEPWW